MGRKLNETEKNAMHELKVLLAAHEVYPTWYTLRAIEGEVQVLKNEYVRQVEEPTDEAN